MVLAPPDLDCPDVFWPFVLAPILSPQRQKSHTLAYSVTAHFVTLYLGSTQPHSLWFHTAAL